MIGTVIHGTLRSQDLLPALLIELRSLDVDAGENLSSQVPHSQLVNGDGLSLNDSDPWWDSEDCSELISDLFDHINDRAPEGIYFGSHPGDGSDFGYWPIEED